jgi:acyl-ACP thioesterase
MNEHVEDIFKDKEQLQVAYIVLELFKNKDNLEIIDKKSVFIYMKEGTEMPTRIISKVFKTFKKHYYELYQKYELKGSII